MALVGALASTLFATGWLRTPIGPTKAADGPQLQGISVPSDEVPVAEPGQAAPIARKLPTTSGAPMARSVPLRLQIPGIEVDSDLMALGLQRDGTLETPPSGFPAGWFTGAPTPGELGPAVIVGHVRFGKPGVFARLAELRSGDEVRVQRADGTIARFRVARVKSFAKSSFPTDKVYGDIGHAGLRLITCGGLNAKSNEFDENVVVFAKLVA